jgi:transposase
VERLNRYYRRSRIAEWKFRLLVRYFALDLTASAVAQLTELSKRTVITIFGKIRQRISEECERQSPFNNGEAGVDESYFGPHPVRGKRSRVASGKTIVFGLFKRDHQVYTEIVTNCKKATLQATFILGFSGHSTTYGSAAKLIKRMK